MLEQPKIYVSAVPDNETTCIPADAIDLTHGTMGYMVNDEIDGLSRPDADVSMSALAGANASRDGGEKISERTITMDVIPLPDVRKNRERLYNILPFGETRRFYVETDGRCVFIDGKIEKLGGAFKSDKLFRFGLSIRCPFPWFQSVRPHSVNLAVGDNTVRYDGDIPAGWTLNVPPQESPPLVGSVGDLEITISGETFAYSGNISVPTICAIPGRKSFTGIRSATGDTRHPAFDAMIAGCQWPMIGRNGNNVSVSCSDATREFFEKQNVFTYRDTYSGV